MYLQSVKLNLKAKYSFGKGILELSRGVVSVEPMTDLFCIPMVR